MADTKDSNRLPIKFSVMRRLIFASGGFCALSKCDNSLYSDVGAWVGTTAHIHSAEDGGPRSDPSMTPEERRAYENLMLLCAIHGREVDDPDVWPTKWQAHTLKGEKKQHEAKVDRALREALKEDEEGVSIDTGILALKKLKSTAPVSADGLLLSVGQDPKILSQGDVSADNLSALVRISKRLANLPPQSMALISDMLYLYFDQASDSDEDDSGPNWGDATRDRVRVNAGDVELRARKGDYESFQHAEYDLRQKEILAGSEEDPDFELTNLGNLYLTDGGKKYPIDFWVAAAQFLWEQKGMNIGSWSRTLDFSVFER